jgi:hypothetical protein
MSAKGIYLCQDTHFCDLLKPVSANAAQVGTRFNLAQWAHASIVLRLGASGGPIGAVTLKAYSVFSGGSGIAIPFKYFLQNSGSAPFDIFGSVQQATAAGYTPTSDAADADILIEIDTSEILAAGQNSTYVELNIAAGSLGTTAQQLDAFAILSGGRSAGDSSASVQQ